MSVVSRRHEAMAVGKRVIKNPVAITDDGGGAGGAEDAVGGELPLLTVLLSPANDWSGDSRKLDDADVALTSAIVEGDDDCVNALGDGGVAAVVGAASAAIAAAVGGRCRGTRPHSDASALALVDQLVEPDGREA